MSCQAVLFLALLALGGLLYYTSHHWLDVTIRLGCLAIFGCLLSSRRYISAPCAER